MDKLCDRVLRKIKDEKICPKPRWHFLLKDCFIWMIFLISLIVGAIAFCLILHVFFTNDWFLYRYLHTTLAGHILISVPYVWFGVLVVFLAIAYHNFKYTKIGYRHETYFVVALSIIGSLLLGTFLHTLGAGEKIEDIVAGSLPFYERAVCCSDRKDIWSRPENGLLGGQIINVIDERDFELNDFRGLRWNVREDDDTIKFEPVEIRNGEKVKIVGEKEDSYIFWAREIRAWNHQGSQEEKIKQED